MQREKNNIMIKYRARNAGGDTRHVIYRRFQSSPLTRVYVSKRLSYRWQLVYLWK